MEINKIISWSKSIKSESREKKQQYDPKYLPKIENYIDMIIARSEYVQRETIRMQRYMEEIKEALTKLNTYGVSFPEEKKINENPLRNI